LIDDWEIVGIDRQSKINPQSAIRNPQITNQQ